MTDGFYEYKSNSNKNQNENRKNIIEKDNDDKYNRVTKFFKENHDKLFTKQNVVGVGIDRKLKTVKIQVKTVF